MEIESLTRDAGRDWVEGSDEKHFCEDRVWIFSGACTTPNINPSSAETWVVANP